MSTPQASLRLVSVVVLAMSGCNRPAVLPVAAAGNADPVSRTVWDGEPVAAPKSPDPISRDDFYHRVHLKSEETIVKAIGEPDSRTITPDETSWLFDRRTFDPKTNRIDDSVELTFFFGVGDKVRYLSKQAKQESIEKLKMLRPVSREEFVRRIAGKSHKQVLELLGRPGERYGYGEDDSWQYEAKTLDSITEKNDRDLTVFFRNGFAHRFLFSGE